MWEELEDILSALPRGLDPLALSSQLRTRLNARQAGLAAEIYRLRERSVGRFDSGYLPYLHRKGLEQATPQRAAEQRVAAMRERGIPGLLWDATCGLGSDAVAALRGGLELVASDRHFETAVLARANLEAQTATGRVRGVLQAQAQDLAVRSDALLLDPDRRVDGRRSLDPRRWSPSLAKALELARGRRAACLKLAPGWDPPSCEELPDVQWEWVSLRGELVELRAWIGSWRDPALEPSARRVVCGLEQQRPHLWSATPEPCPAWESSQLEQVRVLAEPDPAVLRAGLLGNLARQAGLAALAPRCAYLGGDRDALPDSPFLRAWRVLGSCSLDRKHVRRLLALHDVGSITVKKRGHPDPAEVLARRFAGRGQRPGILAVARLERGHRAFLLEQAGAAGTSADPAGGSARE